MSCVWGRTETGRDFCTLCFHSPWTSWMIDQRASTIYSNSVQFTGPAVKNMLYCGSTLSLGGESFAALSFVTALIFSNSLPPITPIDFCLCHLLTSITPQIYTTEHDPEKCFQLLAASVNLWRLSGLKLEFKQGLKVILCRRHQQHKITHFPKMPAPCTV